jgi:hypothetical protein
MSPNRRRAAIESQRSPMARAIGDRISGVGLSLLDVALPVDVHPEPEERQRRPGAIVQTAEGDQRLLV